MSGRAGSFVKQSSGYSAYIPAALPPVPPLYFDNKFISYPTANNLVNKFAELKILTEKTGQQRNRAFNYTDYLEVLSDNV